MSEHEKDLEIVEAAIDKLFEDLRKTKCTRESIEFRKHFDVHRVSTILTEIAELREENERLEEERDKYLFLAHGPKCHQCWWGRRNTPAECSGTYPRCGAEFFGPTRRNFCAHCAKDQNVEDRKPISQMQWVKEYLEKRNDKQ